MLKVDVLCRVYVEFKKSRHRLKLLISNYLTIYIYTLCRPVDFKEYTDIKKVLENYFFSPE